MSKNLVIVESPAKAKTIEKYLGKDFKVLSSIGHIRSIVKKTKDGTPPIDVKNGFKTIYQVDPEKKKVIAELKKAVKSADTVWLATDEDREGEAIAWHLCEVLKLDPAKTKRIVFHEITKSAIEEAVKNPRTVDMKLVEAQQARQILDRIVGFELSPVVWQKVPGGKSAGRVQSPAVRLLVEREREIAAFESTSEFRVTAELESEGTLFKAELPTRFKTEDEARAFLESLVGANYTVSDVTTSPGTRNPSAPFTTSTLQQEANARLGFGSKATMASAQKLYQDGKITYMRTDSVNLSKQAMASAAGYIEKTYGKNYVQVRAYKTKNASAQEAHEAIRPTDMGVRGSEIGNGFSEYDKKLYDLIRNRTLASQMAPARLEKTEVSIEIAYAAGNDASHHLRRKDEVLESTSKTRAEGQAPHRFVAKGEVIVFDGFLKVYGASKKEAELLPKLSNGNELTPVNIVAREIFARPPARYSEGSLVKKLEDLGIGRPSTYATIIDTVQTRGYVEKGESEGEERQVIELRLEGSSKQQAVDGMQAAPAETEDTSSTRDSAFPAVQLETRDTRQETRVENETRSDNTTTAPEKVATHDSYLIALDSDDWTLQRSIVIERTGSNRGKLVPTPAGELIADFLGNYFEQVVDYSFTANVEEHFDDIAENKLARNDMLADFYGPFHALIEKSGDIDRSKVGTNREVGTDPKSGKPIIARFGRFGPMLQLGSSDDQDNKPEFAPLPKGTKLETITLEQALEAFKLPRLLGETSDGLPVRANIGRFGPFLQVGTKTKSTKPLYISLKHDDPHDISLPRALELYAEKLKAEAEKNIVDFGDGIKVLNGRFGPYITDGKKNAKIPKDTDPTTITHELAKELLAAAPVTKKRGFRRKK